MSGVTLLGIAVALLFAGSVVQLLRARHLSEREALPWLGLSLVLLLAVVLRYPLDAIAAWLGVWYAPTLWLVLGVVGLLLICLRLAVGISQLHARVVRLTQEVALLRREEQP